MLRISLEILIFCYSAQILLENALFCRQNARPQNRLFCSKFCRQNLSKPTALSTMLVIFVICIECIVSGTETQKFISFNVEIFKSVFCQLKFLCSSFMFEKLPALIRVFPILEPINELVSGLAIKHGGQ